MNRKILGKKFEIEALEILKNKFDHVEWLSEKHHSTFDFKCIKDGNTYFGDAKCTSNQRPSLSNKQREADFVITKRGDKISFLWKDEFKDNICISQGSGIQIQITNIQWERLNSMKRRGESFAQVLNRILKLKEEKEDKENENTKIC